MAAVGKWFKVVFDTINVNTGAAFAVGNALNIHRCSPIGSKKGDSVQTIPFQY
jgi:hypothetical protein